MFEKLSNEVSAVIKEQVQKIRDEYGITNKIIRNDIFDTLEKLCTVLRFSKQFIGKWKRV